MKFSILDILFPKYCSGCRRLGSYVCLNCQKEIRYMEGGVCIVCGRASDGGITHVWCAGEGEGAAPVIDAFGAALIYKSVVTAVIKDSKYRLAADVLVDFMTLIEPALFSAVRIIQKTSDTFEILPVPLHAKRLRERGFNQSEIIAKRVAKLSGRPVVKYLKRARHNPPQAQLGHDETRAKNVEGIFEVIKGVPVENKDILLVDDVVTTGSTVGEAARALKCAGARRVLVVSLAKG